MSLISIGEVAEMFGVCPQTIRNWVSLGFLNAIKTFGGHRRFDKEEVEAIRGIHSTSEEKATVVYSRVSSHDQKEDLVRQTEELKQYCVENNIENFESIEDLGSGMNYKKKGLLKLLRDIMNDKVKKIIITYKDRLLRFGMELIEYICRIKNIELVVIHKDNPKTFGADLVEDVLSIVTVYSSKMYGRRSHQKKQALKNAANA